MAGLIEQARQPAAQAPAMNPAMNAPGSPQQGAAPAGKLPPPTLIVMEAARTLYGNGEAVASKIMQDGKMDDHEAAELASNLVAAGAAALQKKGIQGKELALSISAALPQVVMLAAEFGERIGGLPKGSAAAFARKALPLAMADFRLKHVQGMQEEQAEGAASNPQEEVAEVQAGV
jgi:hypothetical protein